MYIVLCVLTGVHIEGGPDDGVVEGCGFERVSWAYTGCGDLFLAYENGTYVPDVEAGAKTGNYTINLDLRKFDGSLLKVCCLTHVDSCSKVFHVIAKGNVFLGGGGADTP